MLKLMAIILNYNSSDDSIKCAEYLLKQKKNIYITIVDNCSTDDSKKKLKLFSQKKDIIFLENKQNNGFSAGNNIGLKKASEYGCDYALIINPDMEIRDVYYVEACLKKMEEDEKIAVLGTDIMNMQNQHQNPMRELKYWEEVLWPIILVRNRISKSLPYICDYAKSGYCEKVSGCCFFVRMNFIEEIGYLDDSVFMYSEEPILAATVAREGYREYYYCEKKAFHMHRESEKGSSKKRLKMFFNSRKYYLDNYSKYGKIKLAVAKFSIGIQEKVIISKQRQ